MKVQIAVGSFAAAVEAMKGRIAGAVTGAMRDTMPDAKQELRDSTANAGLGARLANTWRGEVYPKSARSTHPAGTVYSKAPMIVDSFVRGATIIPINGGKYLAIPTAKVPMSRRANGARRRMSPPELEAVFGQALIIRSGRAGHLLAFIDPTRSPGRRVRRARGSTHTLVLMFTLVPSVRMPKLLDINGPAQRWAAAYDPALQRRIGAS